MGRVKKGVNCMVGKCGQPAVRSIPMEKVKGTGLEVEGVGRAYLCITHYKEYKRKSRKERALERWRWKVA